jgi:predicted transcriptional regulator
MLQATMLEAAHILGLSPAATAAQLEERGLLGPTWTTVEASVEDIEAIATEIYQWSSELRSNYSYWVTAKQAAPILGVSQTRVKQLAVAERIPSVIHHTGVHLFRRHQLEVVANARLSRWPRN